MKIKTTAELPIAENIRPPVGSVFDAIVETVENGREAYIVRVGNPHITQFAVFPEECEVVE